MRLFEKLQYILLYILSFLIIGFASIITGDIGFDLLKDPSFYISQLMTDAAILCVIFGTLYNYIDNFKLKNIEYLTTAKAIEDFASSKSNIPSIVSRFLSIFNRKRKIAQHKYNIKKKLFELDNLRWIHFKFFHITFNIGKRRFKDKDFIIWNKGTKEEKEHNLYCRKRQSLEDKLQESFIESSIDNMYVKYDKVTTQIILGGYYSSRSNDSPNEFVTKHPSGKVIKDKVPGMLLSFGASLLVSSLLIDTLVFDKTSLINFSVKLLVLIWNMITTTRYAKNFTIEVVLKDIRFRKSIITEYEKWVIQEAKQKEVTNNDTSNIISTIGK